MKDQQNYKLSSSFRSIHEAKKNQTESYIQQLQGLDASKAEHQKPTKISRKKSKEVGDRSPNNSNHFKLNPTSSAMISQVPVQVIRNRSRQKLESLSDSIREPQQKFSIFDHEKQSRGVTAGKKDKKEFFKKYKHDIEGAFDPETKKKVEEKMIEQESEENEGYLKPSQTYEIPTSEHFSPFTIFQTPLLPCFASEFNTSNPMNANAIEAGLQPSSKQLQSGEGVWKIGKIKIKGKKASMKIDNIEFDGDLISAQGKAGAVSEENLYALNDWKGMWIMQPKDDIFL